MTSWIEWHGGENPVPGKNVDIKWRCGEIDSDALSDDWNWKHSRSGSEYDIVAYRVFCDEQTPVMRKFETGATRDTNTDKLDYKGFLSMIAINQFAEYMHKNRIQADGTVRASDNWKKGIPLFAYEESFARHTFEFLTALEKGDRNKAYELAPAIYFNLQGWMHEEGKARDKVELATETFGALEKY